MNPIIGSIVLYKICENDYRDRPEITNNKNVGDILPAIITTVSDIKDGDSFTVVNLKIFCDGKQDSWHCNVHFGTENGQWNWPVIEK